MVLGKNIRIKVKVKVVILKTLPPQAWNKPGVCCYAWWITPLVVTAVEIEAHV